MERRKSTWRPIKLFDNNNIGTLESLTTQLSEFILSSNKSTAEIKHSLKNTNTGIQNLTQKLSNVEAKVDKFEHRMQKFEAGIVKRIEEAETIAKAAERSATFLSGQYDAVKIATEGAAVGTDNLRKEVEKLSQELHAEKIGRNADTQYQRSCFHLKIAGLPTQPKEDGYIKTPNGQRVKSVSANNLRTLSVIDSLAAIAKIDNFDVEQIDVCHRTSNYYFAPIIIKFQKKQDKENFMRQRFKLKDVDTNQLDVDYDVSKLAEWRDNMSRKFHTKDWKDEIPRIIIHEHLTDQNFSILKEARSAAQKKGYKFPGYLRGTCICVRKSEESEHIRIECLEDISKIT